MALSTRIPPPLYLFLFPPQLPKRLARRLLDLQLLPYIVVTNPHIGQVYRAYRHAFDTLRDLPAPLSLADNENFSKLLRRLVDEHGTY